MKYKDKKAKKLIAFKRIETERGAALKLSVKQFAADTGQPAGEQSRVIFAEEVEKTIEVLKDQLEQFEDMKTALDKE